MKFLFLILAIILFIAALILLTAYICFYTAFFVPKKKEMKKEFDLPPGKIYEPYHDVMIGWMKEAKKLPYEEFCITSFDGLKLYAKYYEYAKGAPIELMFHGYRGSAERDLCGGIQRCFSLGRNAFIVDQRTSGKSEGNVISFGINESRDCLSWVDFLVEHFGADAKIILCGISMGASTVMIASGKLLPKNVVGVLADCGYSTARDIIKKTIREKKLPANMLYPFVKLGAKLYGHFDLEEISPLEAIKNCSIPIFFIHGTADDFVPFYMSQEVFDVCPSAKQLVAVEGAGHGLAYPKDANGYLKSVAEFFTQNGVETPVINR